MVGAEHEKTGAVRKLSRLFAVGASISVPHLTVVVRKAYGLGAMAMQGGRYATKKADRSFAALVDCVARPLMAPSVLVSRSDDGPCGSRSLLRAQGRRSEWAARELAVGRERPDEY